LVKKKLKEKKEQLKSGEESVKIFFEKIKERDKQLKYGKKFNLTVQQVKEILVAKEEK
jgi:hypothetical protein